MKRRSFLAAVAGAAAGLVFRSPRADAATPPAVEPAHWACGFTADGVNVRVYDASWNLIVESTTPFGPASWASLDPQIDR